MTPALRPDPKPSLPSRTARAGARRWLLFVHQLPSHPSNLRVTTWRRLQQIGAMPLKQAVYVLPDSPATREDFEWLKSEVADAGGDASVFAAEQLDGWSDDALVEEFRRSRQEAYAALAREAQAALKRSKGSPRLDALRERLRAIERIDFFGSAGRDRALAALGDLEGRTPRARRPKARAESPAATDPAAYDGRLWITRPRPGVDRMSSAWLIRKFIDPRASFGFAADRRAVPDRAVPFDMFGVDFSHRDGGCTFETLCRVFGVTAPGIARIAAIVHDLDLKESRFGAPECGAVGAMIEGLQLAYPDDDALLAQGMTFFDSLFRSFERSHGSSGPRPVARPRTRRGRAAGAKNAR